MQGQKAIKNALKNMSPKFRPQIQREGLLKAAFLIQDESAQRQIAGGGRGKGKYLKALDHRLTSRTGTLRRSIRVNRTGLPRSVQIGTDLVYGAVHEVGGRISVPSSTVKAHTRSSAFGRKTRPFTVPSHTRRAHSAEYNDRPFLQPALDKIAPQIPAIFVAEWQKAIRASVSGGGR